MNGEALSLYSTLGFSLFPVNKEKRPATPHGFLDAERDLKSIERLFATYRGSGLAIATGKVSGNILVIDIDDRRGGDDSLVKLEGELGHRLPDSIRCTTPSGGQHIYLRLPETTTVSCSVDFRPGIDIRADGGYVVAPPSPGYAWELSCHPTDTTIADAPSELVRLLLERERRREEGKGWESGGFILPQEIGQGGRDNTLAQFAGQLRRGGLDTEMIFEMLQYANITRCKPPLPNKDIKRIARSIGSKPAGDARADATAMVESAKDAGGAIPGMIAHSDILARLRGYACLEAVTTGFPLLDKRVGGGLWNTQVAVLVAPTGAGKTAFALSIVRTVAKRRAVIMWTMEMDPSFLAARIAAPTLKEHYLDLIQDVESHERVVAAVPENVWFYEGRKIDDLVRIVKRVKEQTGGEIPPLVIVDYLQKISLPGEDLREKISQVSEAMRVMAQKLGCPILAISSTSRNGTTMLRKPLSFEPEELVGLGKESGDIEYDANTVITIGLDPKTGDEEEEPEWRDAIVTVAKGRFGPGQKHIAYRLNGKAGAWEEKGYAEREKKGRKPAENYDEKVADAVLAAIDKMGGTAPSKRALADAAKKRKKVALEAIDALIHEGELAVNDRNQVLRVVPGNNGVGHADS
jgi:hypothetical protein